jgi:hypothetical protein
MPDNGPDLRALTRAVNNLEKTLKQFARIAEALNENVVELGRMKKAENE